VQFGEGGEVVSHEALESRDSQLVPAWKKRKTVQRKEARRSLKEMSAKGVVRANYSRHAAKLSDETIRRIRHAYANGEGGYKLLGKRFDISPANVMQIVLRFSYKHVD
jgi:hypothetical protein